MRSAATGAGVSVSTVVEAYERLAAEGVIAAISADRFINKLDKASPGRYY